MRAAQFSCPSTHPSTTKAPPSPPRTWHDVGRVQLLHRRGVHAQPRARLAVRVVLVRAQAQPSGLGEGLGEGEREAEAGQVQGRLPVLGPVQAGGRHLDAHVPAPVDDVGGVHLQQRRARARPGQTLGPLALLAALAAAAALAGVAGDGGVDLDLHALRGRGRGRDGLHSGAQPVHGETQPAPARVVAQPVVLWGLGDGRRGMVMMNVREVSVFVWYTGTQPAACMHASTHLLTVPRASRAPRSRRATWG